MNYTEEEYDDVYNFSYDDFETICEKKDVRTFAKFLLPIVYGLCLVVGLAGNALVVAVYAYFKRLRTLMDTFMVHLAVADLLLLLTLPFWATAAVQGWELGEKLCKLIKALYTINFTCSMLLLASISVDRYLSLSPELRESYLGQAFKRSHSSKICLLVWTTGFLLGTPNLVLSTVNELHDRKVCMVVYPSNLALKAKVSMEVLEIVLSFLIPLMVMLYCYIRVLRKLLDLPPESKKKKWAAIRVLMAVVGIFVITQLPYNIMKLCRVLDIMHMLVSQCNTSKALDQATQITETLALTHCCMNPMLYAFIGSSFKKHVLKFAKELGNSRRKASRTRDVPEIEMSFNSQPQSQNTSTFSV